MQRFLSYAEALKMELPQELRLVGFFALLSLLPFILVLMTAFTRISIVLTFLRQALSTSVPSTPIIVGLSLILTGYVMHPVITEVHEKALKPYLNHEFKTEKGVSEELVFIEKSWPVLRSFMLTHTREKDLELFLEMSGITWDENKKLEIEDLPWFCVIPSFVLSELRMAFMMGFLIFLPFLVVDMVVTSLLMSMGMIMLPPVMISFPFKLLLFVIVDGWRLVVQQVVVGYQR
jgi:flagellar biosynthetic protein FliP